jgi:tetratricopeptide (TPR) repeat protein
VKLEARLREMNQQIAQLVELANTLDPERPLDTIAFFVAAQEALLVTTREVQSEVQRLHRATTEREKLDALPQATELSLDVVALALLRGDYETAFEALRQESRRDTPRADVSRDLYKALGAVLEERPQAIKSVEFTLRRLEREKKPEQVLVHGALLVIAGRLYRDVVSSAHLASLAFRDASLILGSLKENADHPEPLVELAELERRAKRTDEARRLLEIAIERAPHRAGAWFLLGVMSEDVGAWDDADRQFGEGTRIVATERDPLAALSRTNPVLSGTAYFRLAITFGVAHAITIRALDRALSLGVRGPRAHPIAEVHRARGMADPVGNVDNLVEAGRRFIWRGDVEAAVRVLELAVTSAPALATARFQLAEAYRLRIADPASGITRTKALEMSRAGAELVADRVDGSAEPAWALSSRALILTFESAEAAEQWEAMLLAEQAVVLEPTNVFHLITASRVHRIFEHGAIANELLERALAHAPNDPAAVEDGVRYSANEFDFETARSLLPRLADSPWKRAVDGFVKIRLEGHGTDARAALEQARQLLDSATQENDRLAVTADKRSGGPRHDNGFAWAWITLGHCNQLLGRTDDAKRVYERARELARVITDKTTAAIWTGNYDNAIELCKSNTQPDVRRDLLGDLGVAYLCKNQLDEARTAFDELLSLASGKIATLWIYNLTKDYSFLELSDAAKALRDEVVRELEERAALPVKRVPMDDLAKASANATGTIATSALAFVRGRLCMATPDLFRDAVPCYLSVPPSRARAVALARVIARLAEAGSSHLDEITKLLEEPFAPDELCAHVTSAAQVAVLLPLVSDSTRAQLLSRAAEHLGLATTTTARLPELSIAIPSSAAEHGQALVDTVIPAIRKTIEADYGVTIPFIHVLSDPQTRDVQLWVGGGLVATTTITDVSTDEARAWLLDELTENLSSILTLGDAYSHMERWSSRAPGKEIARRTSHVLRLIRLMKSLLLDKTSIANWQAIVESMQDFRKISIDSLLKHTRLRLPSALVAARQRYPSELPREIPDDLEKAIRPNIRFYEQNTYFAAPPVEVARMLAALEPFLASPTPILVVNDPDARPWLRRIAALGSPKVVVFSNREIEEMEKLAIVECAGEVHP